MKIARQAAVLLAVVSAGAVRGTAPQEAQVLRKHFAAIDQQTTRYAYVPFDVAPGRTQIALSYAYDRAGGGNAIDLGLFEPGSLALGSKAFRGWSGGAQQSITVGMDEASPGYWPGPIPAGRWHVVLGLYKIAAAGADVEITVRTSVRVSAKTPEIPAHPSTPLRTGPAWYAGVLHAHTTESDGALTPQQLAAKARGERLDFLAITDHNNTTHQLTKFEAPDLLVITGEEVTTPGGHFNVWGLGGPRDYIDFRILPGDPALAATMEAVRARGALISINHPIADCSACSWTHDIPASVNAIEIANGLPAARQQAMAMWDVLLRSGRRLTAVGESDWHRGSAPLGAPAVRVWAHDLSTRSILDAVRRGRVVVVADGRMMPPELIVRVPNAEARPGDELAVGAGKTLDVAVDARDPIYQGGRVDLVWRGETVASSPVPKEGAVRFSRIAITNGYLRVHVLRSDGTPLAITNPVFVNVGSR